MEIGIIFDSLSKSLHGYEKRNSQIKMSEDLYKLMLKGGFGLIEAPTGIGKSLAYLVAASLSAKQFKQKCIIATSTINLQKQLILKDIPVIKAFFPDLTYEIALGRQNYVCLRKFYNYTTSLFSAIDNTRSFLSDIEYGTKEEFDGLGEGVFDLIKSDKDSCKGRFCSHFKDCFFFKARSKLKDADIIITNHHLVFSDFLDSGEIFDVSDILIFDEAHNIEKNLTGFATLTFNFYEQQDLIKNFFNIMSKFKLYELSSKITPISESLKEELNKISVFVNYAVGYENLNMAQNISRVMYLQESLVFEFINFKQQVEIEFEPDFNSMIEKLNANLNILKAFTDDNNKTVLWLEKLKDIVTFNITNLNIDLLLKNKLYPKLKTIIFLSATLSTNGNFSFIKNMLGIESACEKTFETEFDYKHQAKLILLEDIHDPGNDQYTKDIANLIESVANKIDKGILVLFTSYKMLLNAYDQTHQNLDKLGFRVLKQGTLDNYNMQKLFFTAKTILFGVNSFWEGIDIKGDNLFCVIITKLPFEVPTHPIERAKYEHLKQLGQDAFLSYSLQKAILRFKQGFGRLIRTHSDRGFIIIADNRVLKKFYGKRFLNALPDVKIETTSLDRLNLSLDHLSFSNHL